MAPPRANRARSVPAPTADLEDPPSRVAIEVDQPQQVVKLFEMVLIQIGEEPR